MQRERLGIEGSHDLAELVLLVWPRNNPQHLSVEKKTELFTCNYVGHIFQENQNPFMQHLYSRTLVLKMRLHWGTGERAELDSGKCK